MARTGLPYGRDGIASADGISRDFDERRRSFNSQRLWAFTLPHTKSFTASAGELALVDSTAVAITATLPSARRLQGESLIVKWYAGANAVTVVPASGEYIDTLSSIVLGLLQDAILVVSDGTRWLRI